MRRGCRKSEGRGRKKGIMKDTNNHWKRVGHWNRERFGRYDENSTWVGNVGNGHIKTRL